MFCAKCGKETEGNAKICVACIEETQEPIKENIPEKIDTFQNIDTPKKIDTFQKIDKPKKEIDKTKAKKMMLTLNIFLAINIILCLVFAYLGISQLGLI